MPHISENDLAKVLTFVEGANCTCELDDFEITGRVCFTCRVIEILSEAQKQTAPQSDEVRGAVINVSQDMKDGRWPSMNEIKTIIRAAQSAPVDLEREIAKITDKMFSMAFEGLMAIRDFSYEPEAKMAENTIKEIEKYEERQLKLLPTPSKE